MGERATARLNGSRLERMNGSKLLVDKPAAPSNSDAEARLFGTGEGLGASDDGGRGLFVRARRTDGRATSVSPSGGRMIGIGGPDDHLDAELRELIALAGHLLRPPGMITHSTGSSAIAFPGTSVIREYGSRPLMSPVSTP
jgi:hypothetical protein